MLMLRSNAPRMRVDIETDPRAVDQNLRPSEASSGLEPPAEDNPVSVRQRDRFHRLRRRVAGLAILALLLQLPRLLVAAMSNGQPMFSIVPAFMLPTLCDYSSPLRLLDGTLDYHAGPLSVILWLVSEAAAANAWRRPRPPGSHRRPHVSVAVAESAQRLSLYFAQFWPANAVLWLTLGAAFSR